MAESGVFRKSCSPLNLPCTDGDVFHPDSCNCSVYWRCDNGGYSRFSSAPGTFFDHVTQVPVSKADPRYTEYGCADEPWVRCDTVDSHYDIDDLAVFCEQGYWDGSTTLDPNGPGGQGQGQGQGGGGGGGGDTGAIVGGVIGAIILIAVIAVVVFVFLKKRKATHGSARPSNYQINGSQRSGTDEDVEEVYDVIDDKAVSPIPSQFSIPPYSKVNKQKPTYNNAAFQPDDTGEGYTLAKEIPQKQSLAVPDSEKDNLSRTVSINGVDIPIEDHEGYQIAYPSGSMPRLPANDDQQNDQPPEYCDLQQDNHYE